ncbi:MAG: hypothetical protein ACFB16_11865 [Phormidesmis sp.]
MSSLIKSLLQGRLRGKKAAIASLLIIAPLTLSACATGNAVKTPEGAIEEVTTESIGRTIESAVGESVIVRAEISEIVSNNSFLLEKNNIFSDESILVIDVSDDPLGLSEEDEPEVLVIGEVEQLTIADFETAYGFPLDASTYVEYETQPVVVARSVQLSPDPADIVGNPHLFYNQPIALVGEIEETLSPGVFTIDEDGLLYGDDLLVISTEQIAEIQSGEQVATTGVLRPYIQEEFDTYYDLEWDLELKERIDKDYEEKPVFVADEVYPSGSASGL